MNLKKICIFIFVSLSFGCLQAQAEDMFTGQKKAACEVILCLSTGNAPHECKDSLKKYFKIMVKSSVGVLNPKKTLEARKNFLNICPNVDEKDIDKVNTSKNVTEYSEYTEPTIAGTVEYGGNTLSGYEAWSIYDELGSNGSAAEIDSFSQLLKSAGLIDQGTSCGTLYGSMAKHCSDNVPFSCWGTPDTYMPLCMQPYNNQN